VAGVNKLNKISRILNVVLGFFYLPLSVVSFFLTMASEGTIDATNTAYIQLINLFCFISFIIPFICVISVVLSVVFRKKGHSIMSIIVQFLPMIIFLINMILLSLAENLPKMA